MEWITSPECSEELEWVRYYGPSYPGINLLPALPDLPLTLKSAGEIKFLPGEEASYYIRLPLWLQLLAEDKQRHEIILETSETIHSRTWSGTPSAGFISYFLNCDLWAGDPRDEADSFVVYCPLKIKNESKKLVALNKMCLHAENLGVFTADGILLTNSLTISIREDGSGERIQIADRPPKSFKGAKQLTRPRVRINDNILSKGLTLIKQVTVSD
jgi:hypothetical protein